MLSVIGAASRRALIEAIVPRSIVRSQPMALPAVLSEAQALAELKRIAAQNKVLKSCIGQGYHGTHTPVRHDSIAAWRSISSVGGCMAM